MDKPLYFDYAAATPLDPLVLAAMQPWLSCAQPGNAQARHHAYGGAASAAIETARGQLAALAGAHPDQIIFTSGASEANALAIFGAARHLRASGKTHLIASAVEHNSVLAPLRALEGDGFTLSILPVKPCGMIEAAMIEKAVTKQTGMVCVQAVNNETGTIQPLAEISATLKPRGILLHADAAQAPGRIAFSVQRWGADFASFSAQKFYGPQGIGALYARNPALTGARAGTPPTALIAGFGAACALVADDRERLQNLRARFLNKTAALSPVIHGHSDPVWNVPGILNIRFPGIGHEALVMALPGLAFGTGAACSAGNISHIITAIAGERAAREAIRLSFGRFTTEADIDSAAAQIVAAVTDIKSMLEAA